jgi:hypothetical protein
LSVAALIVLGLQRIAQQIGQLQAEAAKIEKILGDYKQGPLKVGWVPNVGLRLSGCKITIQECDSDSISGWPACMHAVEADSNSRNILDILCRRNT